MTVATVAEKSESDYGEYVGVLRYVLSVTELGGRSGLVDWISTKPVGKGLNPSVWRESGGNCVHATATRKPAGSHIPLHEQDWFKAPFVRAIHALPAPYPAILRGRYSQNPELLDKFEVVHPILKRYRTAESVQQAKDMLDHIYNPKRVIDGPGQQPRLQKIWEVFGYDSVGWMDSSERKAWNRLQGRLDELVGPAVMAWVEECQRQGLKI